MSAHGRPNVPPGNSLLRMPCTTTARSGMSPRPTSSPVCASITGVDDVMITPAPSLAPCRTRAPSTIMQRDPMKQSSSTTTGTACGGSSTPPIPTPPERWTRLPICAHDATVAQVSTIVPSST